MLVSNRFESRFGLGFRFLWMSPNVRLLYKVGRFWLVMGQDPFGGPGHMLVSKMNAGCWLASWPRSYACFKDEGWLLAGWLTSWTSLSFQIGRQPKSDAPNVRLLCKVGRFWQLLRWGPFGGPGHMLVSKMKDGCWLASWPISINSISSMLALLALYQLYQLYISSVSSLLALHQLYQLSISFISSILAPLAIYQLYQF